MFIRSFRFIVLLLICATVIHPLGKEILRGLAKGRIGFRKPVGIGGWIRYSRKQEPAFYWLTIAIYLILLMLFCFGIWMIAERIIDSEQTYNTRQ